MVLVTGNCQNFRIFGRGRISVETSCDRNRREGWPWSQGIVRIPAVWGGGCDQNKQEGWSWSQAIVNFPAFWSGRRISAEDSCDLNRQKGGAWSQGIVKFLVFWGGSCDRNRRKGWSWSQGAAKISIFLAGDGILGKFNHLNLAGKLGLAIRSEKFFGFLEGDGIRGSHLSLKLDKIL